MMRRGVLVFIVAALLVLTGWVGLRAAWAWRLKSELREAQRDLAAQRYGAAKSRLSALDKEYPGRADVAYWLGTCEMAEGHSEAALSAWGRIPDDAPETAVAALSRGKLALETGHYAIAETCLERASHGTGAIRDEARSSLQGFYYMLGWQNLYRRELRLQAEQERDPSGALRLLWGFDHDALPVTAMRDALEEARRLVPEDDRVWLALANLATRTGRLDDARTLLAQCRQTRPDDPYVWLAQLDWARASERRDEVLRAAGHLPATRLSQGQVLALHAWLAAQEGDRRGERSALEKLIKLEPGSASALERLADLAAQVGETNRVAQLRQRKAAFDAARDHYHVLVNLPDSPKRAAELARAAEAVDRLFDAKLWWSLAARVDPASQAEAASALARLPQPDPEPAAGAGTLAELLGPAGQKRRTETSLTAITDVPQFIDDARSRGIVFSFDNGQTDHRHLPESMSGGVGLLDFDGDGWLDIYAVQGGPFPPHTDRPPLFRDRLFRNTGDGHFEDATVSSGLAGLAGGYGHGVAVGDYDNDGRPDLLVTRWRSYALYHNVGKGRFEDLTATAGLGGGRDWPISAAWADLDNDGDLDLYVCHYLKYDPETTPVCRFRNNPENVPCDPRSFPGLPDHVFRNDAGHFVDVTDQAGIVDRDGRGMGVVAADLDGDGKIDLFVANDTTANYFFRNRGGFRFTEQAHESGLATNAAGGYLAGMGVACGDFDGDGKLDLAVTNFLGESTTLYHNHGGGLFSDRTDAAGLAAPTRFVLGFGLAALDANNDGRLDLAQANGHIGDYRPSNPYAMPAQLFLGEGAGKLREVSERAGQPWQVLRLARGLATGDFDNDGRVDIVLVSENAPLALFHNQLEAGNQNAGSTAAHFLTLELEGSASNRDAVGAHVAVTVAGKTQVADRFGGGSYLSAGDKRLHFGLGSKEVADLVEVIWPSGRRDRYERLAADTGYRIREGGAAPMPLSGFNSPANARPWAHGPGAGSRSGAGSGANGPPAPPGSNGGRPGSSSSGF